MRPYSEGAEPVAATYTSWRRDRLLEATEGDGTFAPTFIEKLQQAPSDNRILHELSNMRCISRINNSARHVDAETK